MNFHHVSTERIIRHAHLFCGVGAGAKGFNMAKARVGPVHARFVCTGGIDVDAGAIRNFERLTGTPGTVMDLFARDQYIAFHGREPPMGWEEETPERVRVALSGPNGERPDVVFLSAPCKGFSGLLSTTQSLTDKYQALNALTLRGVWLVCEAFKDGPIPLILFENVPRIMTRGRGLLDQICAILRSYGYNVAETVHDCGELGNLAQSRKRFLLIARQRELIPNFVYMPEKSALRGVGEVIGKLPLPGDPIAGPMHRVPMLQWKTWLRLALVPAGKDWRALNDLVVEEGVLRDYGIVPERPLRDGCLGVIGWGESAGVLVGNQRSPLHGRVSVADIRTGQANQTYQQYGVKAWLDTATAVSGQATPGGGPYAVADPRPIDGLYRTALGVTAWIGKAGTIGGRGFPLNGAYSVADPRPGYGPSTHSYVLGVLDWGDYAGVLGGHPGVTAGANAIADPRLGRDAYHNIYRVADFEEPAHPITSSREAAIADPRCENGHPRSVMLGVLPWQGRPAPTVKGDMSVGTGPYAIGDIRLAGKPRFNNTFRIVRLDEAAKAVAGPGGPAGGACIADDRIDGAKGYETTKYRVTPWDGSSRAVIGASTTGDGAFAIADIRGGPFAEALHGKYRVEMWIGPASRSVIGGRDNGAFAVADVRCNWGNRHESVLRVTAGDDNVGAITSGGHSVTGGQPAVADARRESYQTCGHYGVWGWGMTPGTVSANLAHDNGPGNVADPRPKILDVAEPIILPQPSDRLVCRIVSMDETWHRPFTTLELAALQSIVDPEEAFYQDAAGIWQCRFAFDLESQSDATKREWIGNAVPPESAARIASTMGEAIILAEMGETFTLSSREIWVKPGAMALMVDTDQVAFDMDAGRL